MAYTRRPAQGTIPKFDNSGTDAAIPDVQDFQPPTIEPITKEVTGYGDTDTRTDSVGVRKNSGFKITFLYDPKDTIQAALMTKVLAGTKVGWTIVYPTATGMTDEFSAFMKVTHSAKVKDFIQVTLENAGDIDGAVTRTITS